MNFLLKLLILIFSVLLLLSFPSFATTPEIGAQIYIELGQTKPQIDNWFKIHERQRHDLLSPLFDLGIYGARKR